MKKICPLTFLTKLASLTNLTGRGTGQNLSNEKTLSTGQEELVSGCGPYRPAEPRTRGPYKPRRPSATDAQIESNTDEQVLSKHASALVSGSGPWKPVNPSSLEVDALSKSSNCKGYKLDEYESSRISGGAGAKKPPRRASLEAQKPNENSEKQQLNTKLCELVSGGSLAVKPPRAIAAQLTRFPSLKTKNAQELSRSTCSLISGSTGYKPPRTLELKLSKCKLIYGGSGAYKPPRAARVGTDSKKTIIPVESSEG